MIIVTGANGFIGSALIWDLNQRGYQNIIAVDSVPLFQRNLLRGRIYKKFLLKNELWDFLKSSDAKSTETIFHMGACSSTTETNWDFLKENNLEYSQKLFTWCKNNQTTYIYASSAATYGAGENGFNDSTQASKLKPLNLYGLSKLLMDEWALQQIDCPKNWYGLKFFNVYGPNELFKGDQASVAFKAFHQINNTGKLKLFKSYHPSYKDGDQLRDFVYVKDITNWMCQLMIKKPTNGIYNMGSGEARSWNHLASAMFQSLNKPLNIDWIEVPENIRNQYQYFTKADMSSWQNISMPSPKWSLENGIADYVKNHLLTEANFY